ncbi:OLC1v1000412C1 [Oldenlandia corymbosa var. corymbosa]|uniref:OLC1v1000412C1 n=1 Tax=Oldenlandia corymbosa var. corymbosa TaxID=529605 RepID=A0AAV1D4A7_OLDCO|nr:OLC1v1000412C1 [Oldenlandia corymbosa var. corymbosa]
MSSGGEVAEHVKSAAQDLPPAQSYPWLLISDGKQCEKHYFFSVTENQCYKREICWLRNQIIFCSSHGWIVSQDKDTKICYLSNPVSTQSLELPPCSKSIRRVFLSKSPGDPDCFIFIFGYDQGNIEFCKLGDQKFVEQNTTLGDRHLSELIVFKGKIYGLMSCFRCFALVTVDIVGSTLQIKPLIKDGLPFQIRCPLPPENNAYDTYMINSHDGEEVLFVFKIYSASLDYQVSEFKVFRLDFDNMISEELEDIGGERAIFVCHFYGMPCSRSEPGIKANSIYYVEGNDNRLYVHNLENKSRLLKLPCPIATHDAWLSWVMI